MLLLHGNRLYNYFSADRNISIFLPVWSVLLDNINDILSAYQTSVYNYCHRINLLVIFRSYFKFRQVKSGCFFFRIIINYLNLFVLQYFGISVSVSFFYCCCFVSVWVCLLLFLYVFIVIYICTNIFSRLTVYVELRKNTFLFWVLNTNILDILVQEFYRNK